MIKTLLVGLGQIGMGYDLNQASDEIILTHAKALTQHPEFELQAAVDPLVEHQKIFAQIYHKPAYATLEQALTEQSGIDLIVVSTPTALHASTIDLALSRLKPRAILCEKPLSYSILEAESLVNKCASSNVSLFVNYIRRADPGAIRIKEMIESEILSGPIKGVAWYSKGFLHNGSHFFNLLEFWLGQFRSAKLINEGRRFGENDKEPDVQIIFERGEVTFLAAWEESYSHYSIELLSPSGRLNYGRGGGDVSWQPVVSDPLVPSCLQLSANPIMIENDMNRYQWNMLDQMFKALSGHPSSICSGVDALNSIRSMARVANLIMQ